MLNLKKVGFIATLVFALTSCSGGLNTPEGFVKSHIKASMSILNDTFKDVKRTNLESEKEMEKLGEKVTKRADKFCQTYAMEKDLDVCVYSTALTLAIFVVAMVESNVKTFSSTARDIQVSEPVVFEDYIYVEATFIVDGRATFAEGEPISDSMEDGMQYYLVKENGVYKISNDF